MFFLTLIISYLYAEYFFENTVYRDNVTSIFARYGVPQYSYKVAHNRRNSNTTGVENPSVKRKTLSIDLIALLIEKTVFFDEIL